MILVAPRIPVILAVCVAVVAASGLGLNNGMVLRFDDYGHLALESPRVRHAHSHAEGADHGPHDFGHESDHQDLHDLINSCSESPLGTQKAERSASGLAAADHQPVGVDVCVPPCGGPGLRPPAAGADKHAGTRRGGTAHIALACLRSIVLLT